MKVAVINSSSDVYNLAVHRITHYHERLGDEVTVVKGGALFTDGVWDAQKAYFSTIFTWDLPSMIQDVNLLSNRNIQIEIGGPAPTAMAEYVYSKTGIMPVLGLDPRFEFIMADDHQAVFTSRGCPRGCDFCIVQQVEGKKMIEYDDFPIPVGDNPWVCDNNILATSWRHQNLLIDRMKNVKNLDLNSGFDDRIFAHDPDKYYELYSKLHLERWRFAYDQPDQKEPLTKCVEFLHSKGIKYERISVFCLVGWPGTTFKEAREKLEYLIAIGTSPYAMRYRPLDSLVRDYTPPDWDLRNMESLFAYYNVPWKWRTTSFEEFHPDTYQPPVAKEQGKLL